ncbi:MAG TPA: universal stress protein [Acidobacteriaceae bacterium]|jgi:nucleotide-binding universal stress UspA family protein
MTTHPLPLAQVPVRLPHVDRILVPIDFSDTCLTALNRAIDIARIYNSTLVLMHVMANQTANGMATILPGALLQMELDLQDDLDHLRLLAVNQGIPCTVLFRKGPVLENIENALRHEAIDLLVVATHGGRGVHGIFLGSTAERLIRHVTIPVLTVGCKHHQPDWSEKGARHVLFAGDFCPETLCGLSLAMGIQQTAGARLSVVQVVPQKTCAEALQAIRDGIQSLVPPGTAIYTPSGSVGRTVCDLARKLEIGLISLGVHRNSFARELFGTGLLEILLNAPCPVLSVRQCD